MAALLYKELGKLVKRTGGFGQTTSDKSTRESYALKATRPWPLPCALRVVKGQRVAERHFMTILIHSPPAVPNHAQLDNKNKYLTIFQALLTKMDFTLKDNS